MSLIATSSKSAVSSRVLVNRPSDAALSLLVLLVTAVCENPAMPAGTKDDPWELSTAPRTSIYTVWADETSDPPTLFCQIGSTQLRYQLRCIDDLHAWLVEQDDWVDLGAADEQKPAKEGTVEAWGRSEDNPVGGWYGLRKGYRCRFGMYVPPLLEALGKAELTHEPRNNRVRAAAP
jgi:hypothetical protein